MMTQKKRRFENVIAAKETALREELSKIRESIAVEPTADDMEKVVGLDARDLESKRLVRITRQLEELRAARTRLAEGEYGICENCGEDIAAKRLEVVPWAIRCVSCQELKDQQMGAIPGSEHEYRVIEVR